ncbi:MAG: glycosyl transferase group 1 [uncultured bacterium]|nr:MAG: glycosyl transferase group 1 [uncultured bacterium]
MAKPYVLVTLEYPPQVGGVANYYANIVLADAAQSIEVIHNNTGKLTKPWLKIFIALWRRQKREPIRKIIVGQILPVGTVVWLWHLIFGTPYIVYIHGMDITVPMRYARKRWLGRKILQGAETIVTVSQFSAARILDYYPDCKVKIAIIPPAPHILPEHFLSATNGASTDLRAPFMLSVGRLVKRKGFADAITAFASLSSQYKNWHYYIAGEGPEHAELEALIVQNQLQSRVHLLGLVTDEFVARLYMQCSFFILPAQQLPDGDFEGYGTVVVEANSFGKPAIGTRSGGVSDVIQHQTTGWLVDANNPQALLEAITKFCDQPQLINQLGSAAKQWSEKQTWPNKAKQLQALLER